MDLIQRPRRLRGSENLRKMVRETRMDKSSLIYPLFVKEGTGIEEEIPSMEGQFRYSIDRLPFELERLQKAGVNSVMLFGIPDHKDEVGSGAYDPNGIVQKALREAKKQFLEVEHKLPDAVMACVGGGSNSIGMFADFIEEPSVKLIGVEAAGKGIETGEHASAMALGEPGVLHGMRSYLLQDEDGNVKLAHSISAGLDYPGVGPEHAYLRDSGRATYVSVTDTEAMDALMELCKLEGIIPAIESAHAVAYASKYAKELTEKLGAAEAKDKTMIICLSGRGDKDVNTIADYLAGKGYLN